MSLTSTYGKPTNLKLHVPYTTVLCLVEDFLKEKSELFFRDQELDLGSSFYTAKVKMTKFKT